MSWHWLQRQGYTEGAIDFLNVISVQAALLQSQSQLVNVDTEIIAGAALSACLPDDRGESEYRMVA
jgi:hypothetical protein